LELKIWEDTPKRLEEVVNLQFAINNFQSTNPMQFLLLSTFAAAALMAALAAVPLIIHLINMMRHRRVEWAAMEFLLQSYKKQRNWIFLKQLLLLLLRMAAMVAIVAMLARLDTADQLAAIFGGTTTHHYVLLDDSYSMSDEGSGRAAFEAA
jgi:hypothetical protein